MKAIFLTGQSNWCSCQLNSAQRTIADILSKEGISVVPLNFPYDTQMEGYRESNLFTASLSNGLQYLFSRMATFSNRYREQVLRQFEDGSRYLVLAGSCGLELFNNLNLPNYVLKKVHIFAYGPVARGLPKSQVTMLQGRDDWLSKRFFKQVDYQIECGHMDYLECPEFITLLLEKAHAIAKGDQFNETKKN